MPPGLAWLTGRHVKNVEKVDCTWCFVFDDGSSIATEGPWRLIAEEGTVVTSEDHGHPFGLPAPVDACQRMMAEVGGKAVERFHVDEGTGDLALFFGERTIVEFLQLSCGYESWRTAHGKEEIICTGGGSLSFVNFGI